VVPVGFPLRPRSAQALEQGVYGGSHGAGCSPLVLSLSQKQRSLSCALVHCSRDRL